MVRFFNAVNMQDSQTKNFVLEQLTNDSVSPVQGEIWFNITDNIAKLKLSSRVMTITDQYVTGVTGTGIVAVTTGLTPSVSLTSSANSGAPLLSAGTGSAPAFGPLNLAGGSTIVTGTLPIGNIPTIPWSNITTTPTTVAGYGITNAVTTAMMGAVNGVASLDGTGKVPVAQLPSAVLGAMSYQGVWNANTNSPALVSGTGTKGFYYKVTTPGTTSIDGNASWTLGDLIVFDGTTWDLVQGGTSDVVSVAGKVGAVTLVVADVSGAAPLASPALTGTPTAPTPATSDNGTTLATTAFVKSQSYLTGNQTITVTGDATGSGTTAITLALANSGVTAGTYNNSATSVTPITVDAKGRVTATGTVVTITPAWGSITSKPTTLAGYAITDAAPLASPALTGTPTSTTAAANTNTTQIATTAFVIGQAATVAPLMNSAAAVGTSLLYARQDHVHPSDTVKANLASPTFTGTPAAPTASTSDSSTQIATTAFVKAQAYVTSITLSGDVTGSGSSAITTTLANSGVTAGTYNNSATAVTPLTVDVKGRVTGTGTAVTVTPAWGSITSKPTTLSGFGITDAVNTSLLGANSGVATLDSAGKVPTSQLPAAVLGGMNYQGVWNATTNIPALASGVGSKGYYYKVTTPGTTSIDGNANWTLGDLIIFDGSTWEQVQGGSSDVVSVAGKVGAVTLGVADVSGAAPLASPALTGTPTSTTAAVDTNTTQVATTAFVIGQGYLKAATAATTYLGISATAADSSKLGGTAAASYALLASPTFTGTPAAPTPATSDNTTKIATTAFVKAQGFGKVATGLIGDGTTLALTFTHSLGLVVKNACFISVCIEATGEIIYPDITLVDANSVLITYGAGLMPATGAHRVTCIG